MRRLKNKYKWSNRTSHFDMLNRHKHLIDMYGRAWMFGLKELKEHHPMGILSVLRSHWTDEQLERIKNGTCLANESALDGVADTTNSALKESHHSLDEFGSLVRKPDAKNWVFNTPFDKLF